MSAAYFCSDDDFVETHRTAYEDRLHPARMFTTGHFSSFKYRPLNRLLNLGSYLLGGGEAWAYRYRNLLCHLLSTVLLYLLVLLLGRPPAVACAAALLFAWHPLANQTLVGAVNTNSAAHALLLLSLVVFVATMHRTGLPRWGAVSSALLALAAALFYDTNIVAFAMLYLYLGVAWVAGAKVRRALLGLSAVSAVLLPLYLGVRHLAVRSGFEQASTVIPGLALMAQDAASYAGALLLPLDPVLANQWFGAPFPSEANFSGWYGVLCAAAAGAVLLAVLGILYRLHRAGRPRLAWATDGFLLAAAILPLLPVILFSGHPSETYVYLPVAFLMAWAAAVFHAWCGISFPRHASAVFALCVMAAAVVFAMGTWTRNARVAACGGAARKILASVPFSRFPGDATLLFADAPGEPPSRHYGFYGFRGIDVIANRERFQSHTLQRALQLVSGNLRLAAEVVDAETLAKFRPVPGCPSQAAFWVRASGALVEQHPPLP